MLLLAFIGCLNQAQAQQFSHWIKAGTNAPYQYSLQYELDLSGKAFIAVESGIYGKAYEPILFNAIDRKSQGSITSALMRSVFKSASMHTLYTGWKVQRFSASAFIQQGNLRGEGTPTDLIGIYYDVSPESLPYLNFAVKTYQLGLNIGYRQPITKRLELHTSIGVSRIVGSTASFSSSFNGVASTSSGISDLLANQLRESIMDYGYIPVLNIHFAYRFAGGKAPKLSKSTVLSRQ